MFDYLAARASCSRRRFGIVRWSRQCWLVVVVDLNWVVAGVFSSVFDNCVYCLWGGEEYVEVPGHVLPFQSPSQVRQEPKGGIRAYGFEASTEDVGDGVRVPCSVADEYRFCGC